MADPVPYVTGPPQLPAGYAQSGTSSTAGIGAIALQSVSGSATLSFVSAGGMRPAAWLLDAASTETVAGSQVLPETWATFNVVAVWENHGAGAGDVVLQAVYGSFGSEGDASDMAGTTGSLVTDTAGATSAVVETTLASGVAVPEVGEEFYVKVSRVGANGGDTLANDIGLLRVRFERAT